MFPMEFSSGPGMLISLQFALFTTLKYQSQKAPIVDVGEGRLKLKGGLKRQKGRREKVESLFLQSKGAQK